MKTKINSIIITVMITALLLFISGTAAVDSHADNEAIALGQGDEIFVRNVMKKQRYEIRVTDYDHMWNIDDGTEHTPVCNTQSSYIAVMQYGADPYSVPETIGEFAERFSSVRLKFCVPELKYIYPCEEHRLMCKVNIGGTGFDLNLGEYEVATGEDSVNIIDIPLQDLEIYADKDSPYSMAISFFLGYQNYIAEDLGAGFGDTLAEMYLCPAGIKKSGNEVLELGIKETFIRATVGKNTGSAWIDNCLMPLYTDEPLPSSFGEFAEKYEDARLVFYVEDIYANDGYEIYFCLRALDNRPSLFDEATTIIAMTDYIPLKEGINVMPPIDDIPEYDDLSKFQLFFTAKKIGDEALSERYLFTEAEQWDEIFGFHIRPLTEEETEAADAMYAMAENTEIENVIPVEDEENYLQIILIIVLTCTAAAGYVHIKKDE